MGRPSNLPKILAALEHAPAGLTQTELRRITGVSVGTVHTFVHRLHDEGRVHIASWKTDTAGKQRGGVYQARYRLGKGTDVPKPAPLTPKQVHDRYMARVRQTAGGLDELRARWAEAERRRYWKAKPVRRDPLVSALFGSPELIHQERARMREEKKEHE